MNRKRVLSSIVALSLLCSLGGCGSNDEEVVALRNIEALNGESELVKLNMSVNEKEAAIYAQVSDRTLLDLSSLAQVSSSDRDTVIAYMNSVDAQLCGTVSENDGVIDPQYIDYLLTEFQRTPYYWQRTSMNIRGMDATSRSIVVDVTYKTIDFKKEVQPDSTITRGEPNYEQLMKVRYNRWMEIMSELYEFNVDNYDEALRQEKIAEFESHYGNLEDIFEGQSDSTPSEEMFETGNQRTCTGLIDHEQEQSGGTMSVRFILVPNYTLGINQGYTCKHMYLLDYRLDNDMTEGRSLYNEEDNSAVADSIYNTLYRHYKCLDESNFTGLYGLVNNFKSLDKYYEDYFSTSYRKYDSFTLSIFNIQGTRIECGATVSKKIRAKGSNMTLPIYTDRYYYVIELVDGGLSIEQEVLLSSTLEGEPKINTEEVDTAGFTSAISLTNDDKRALEQLIADFGSQQLLADSSSDKFSSIVDMSLSVSQLDSLKSNMLDVKGKTKSTWIVSYLQGHQNYASIKCRELVQSEDSTITEYLVTYDFIYKGGKWVIYDYQIISRVKLDTTDLTTKNALCVVSAGSIDSFTSQVQGTTSTDNTETVEEDIGEVLTFEEYTPIMKSKKEEPEVTMPDVTDITDSTGDDLSETGVVETDISGEVSETDVSEEDVSEVLED